jgi:hypothetical protein
MSAYKKPIGVVVTSKTKAMVKSKKLLPIPSEESFFIKYFLAKILNRKK